MQSKKQTKENAMAGDTDNEFPTVIGPDAKFKGELSFEKGVKHLGQFEGTIQSKGHLVIAEGAKLAGDVTAGSVDVQGEVKGNLNASSKVRLTQTARLEGDLHTAKLEVQEGAVFVGRCVVGRNGVTPPPPSGGPPTRSAAKEPEGAPVAAGAKK